jgi:hypothetical protein
MRTFVFWGVLLTGLAIGGWLARGIGNRPIEHETWSGATRQSFWERSSSGLPCLLRSS